MTDNEIIKALECCEIAYDQDCTECPLYPDDGEIACREVLREEALDLITRQQAEIESLKENRDELWEIHCRDTERSFIRMNEIDALKEELKTAKSEAVKEFAEKLKSVSKWLPLTAISDSFVTVSDIDNLVKEMIKE